MSKTKRIESLEKNVAILMNAMKRNDVKKENIGLAQINPNDLYKYINKTVMIKYLTYYTYKDDYDYSNVIKKICVNEENKWIIFDGYIEFPADAEKNSISYWTLLY